MARRTLLRDRSWASPERRWPELLLGRRSELEALDGLLSAVRQGRSGVLVVRGDPGIGKSALLASVAQHASGCRVAQAAGVESEPALAFAGLHQLCGPMLDLVGHLPAPQRDALSAAFGLIDGPAPDRFLIGLAVLGLLAEVAEEQPLVCLVDDAQWLDRESAQAFAFVARRLFAESVAFVFAARPVESQELAGLPELAIDGLGDQDAAALLQTAVHGRLDERVRDRIVAETRGNPLALLELPRELRLAELAGGFGLPGAQGLSGTIEDSFRRRLARLPIETRRLLLLAAAEPVGDALLVGRAAERLAIGPEAADTAETGGLVSFGARVIFRHPLVRSAAYRSASPEERREVHRALAEATDRELDPDRRAWHLAQATPGPDDEVASELERSASRAQARGGLSAAAAFLERSAALTVDPERRAARALAAARTKAQAGEFDAALELLATVEAGPLDELQLAQTDMLHGQIVFASSRGSDAPPLLLRAAKRLEPLDVNAARDTYLEALFAALFAGRLAPSGGVLETAVAARSAPPAAEPPRAADLLLDGYARTITDGYAVGAPILQRAVRAFGSEAVSTDEVLRYAFLASYAAQALWDEEGYRALPARQIQLAREAGALSVLPLSLTMRIGAHLHAGELDTAASLLEELTDVTEATGIHVPPYAALALAAWHGREDEATALIETSMNDVVARGEGIGVTFIEWVTAVLYNGLGRYPDALAAAVPASARPEELQSPLWLQELVEAAIRSGEYEQAANALEQLSQMTAIIGTEWALGIETRSRALLSEGDTAEGLYCDAIAHLARTEATVELARAYLLYGEWLRSEQRPVDAREQLRIANEIFLGAGAEGFAERARRELLAAGGTTSKRPVEPSGALTPQEAQVARLARDGLSNSEIGARLFISRSTVQYHLRKVFVKLEINSRTQLHRVLPATRTPSKPKNRSGHVEGDVVRLGGTDGDAKSG
jgi:DNA-binding CsgD family transcriptional regulator